MAAIGDELAMLFGCNAPIVMRPSANNAIYPHSSGLDSVTSHAQYRVVGECFVHGMMDGEIILGDLPRNIHGQFNANGLKFGRKARYIDVKTKTAHEEDPRIEAFLAGLVGKGV